jgi:transcriptional regulator with XRE-family HTH domain
MSKQHGASCGRQIAIRLQLRGAPRQEIVTAICGHCNVSPLRAYRIAHGYTLVEVADLLRKLLRESGTPSEGLAHQTVSRWENGLDSPTERYFDALCRLYRTRPDLLGFGHDYSVDDESDTIGPQPGKLLSAGIGSGNHSFPVQSASDLALPQVLYGTSSLGAVELLEQRAEESGYNVYSGHPADFIPARMIDLASIQGLLLQGQTLDVQRRLHRVAAKNAGFIGIRLTDVAVADETFSWFSIARRAARQAQDAEMEAWVAGHVSDGYSCYGVSFEQGLKAAKIAQTINGSRPNHGTLFGYLAEAGNQARLGRRRETLAAVRSAQRVFEALPQEQIAADGIRIPEYFLCWHQSNALSIIGEARLADPLRSRALKLPMGKGDLIGRALLGLDEASLRFRDGEVDEGSRLVKQVWDEAPADLRPGQIVSRTKKILGGLEPLHQVTQTVRSLRDYLHDLNGQ